MDEWAAIEHERRALAEDLSGIPDAGWNERSLCSEWRVRDVVGHLISGATMSSGAAFRGLVKHGFNFNRFMAQDAIVRGSAAPEVLLAEFTATATNRSTPPMTKPVDVLLDTVCHGQDIRRPLGLRRDWPADSLAAVADRLKGYGFPFGTRKRIAGIHLVAADTGWSTGEGPEASGPLEALVMVMAGRHAALADITGPAVPMLEARLPAG